MMAGLANIFISYGRKDAREFAFRLRTDLETAGWRVWLDVSEIGGGADWASDIEAAIERCDLMLALMSPAALESTWCKAEQLRAIRKGKPLIPLRLFPDVEPPLHLEPLNFFDFSHAEQYSAALRDLMSDMRARQAFRASIVSAPSASATNSANLSASPSSAPKARPSRQHDPFGAPRKRAQRPIETPDYAPSIHRQRATLRRAVRDLQNEAWGSRQWWTYFAFASLDVRDTARLLQAGEWQAPYLRGEALHSRYDKFVRLNFRPRTPDSFNREGHRPSYGTPISGYTPMPVYLAFDLEGVLLLDEAKFSDGDADKTRKTYSTAQAFRELPFERIYHDSWFMPDEKEEVLRHREAQILIPERLNLEALQGIWLRSPAEYDTLRHLVPPEVWRRWRDKAAVRHDLHLFHQRRLYVERVHALSDDLRILFHLPTEDAATSYRLRLTLQNAEHHHALSYEGVPPALWTPSLPEWAQRGYSLQLFIEDDLAYQGHSQAAFSVF